MKKPRITRRRFLLGGFAAVPLVCLTDAVLVEPEWIRIRQIRIGNSSPAHRLVHFTDLHHKGDRDYLKRIVREINKLAPDIVCFTGDLIEEEEHLAEALELLHDIKAPMYGVPGNHDYWSNAPFEQFSKTFAASGGAWLLDSQVLTPDDQILITGASNLKFKSAPMELSTTAKNVMLMHYPAWVKKLENKRFDLILAGHSHGGQVRLPFIGAPIVPFGVDEFEVGIFQTPAGPLYVNPGLGWFPVPVRFRCRPEITLFEL